MPAKTASLIKERAYGRGFASTSQYIRYLVDLDDDLISADELLGFSKKADKEFRQGKLVKAKSLAELL
ncbi:MAG: hypothetical protein HYZ51_03950 [Candidatus Doudnabacteria bacterium]|nr:hypothetical protein [Candidatus Doudnabacteria bacterium]